MVIGAVEDETSAPDLLEVGSAYIFRPPRDILESSKPN